MEQTNSENSFQKEEKLICMVAPDNPEVQKILNAYDPEWGYYGFNAYPEADQKTWQ